MKCINEKDYIFSEQVDGMWKFITNPNKLNFDKEIIFVERARFITEDGQSIYYDYIKQEVV